MANDAALRALGKKYGQSTQDFTTASGNVLADILIAHCNENIKLMSNQIKLTSKSGSASTLASSMESIPVQNPNSVSVKIVTSEYYWKFVNYGVKGLKHSAKKKLPIKPPNEPKYKFRNLGVPKKMWKSFMTWAARAGIKEVNKITLSRVGKSKIKGVKDNITVAKQLAVMTKIGGIEPKNFLSKALNEQRNKELRNAVKVAMGQTIRINIINSIK
tara:strand:+ start:125 stop:772 length:648 start_codon:yes stop_codon:yes gene_type:complete